MLSNIQYKYIGLIIKNKKINKKSLQDSKPIHKMQIPISDADFYQRKISRLEKDIASLNQQLNVARSRLRSAEDFQIKYELLLRQSQQQNMRIRKAEQAQKYKISEMMTMQIQKINEQWMMKMIEKQQQIKQKQSEERLKLIQQLNQLTRKNKQMAQKAQQMDILLFKNKKIARDLQSLQEIIQQNRIMNQRQRQQQLQSCRESLTRKFNEKIASEREQHEQKVKKMQDKYDKLQIQMVRLQMIARQSQRYLPESPTKKFKQSSVISKNLSQELQQIKQMLRSKDQEIEQLQNSKIQQEQKHSKQVRQLKQYIKQLEQKIYKQQQNHQVQLINFKNRMEQTRIKQLKQKQKQCEIVQKKYKKEMLNITDRLQKEKSQLENKIKLDENQKNKLKQDKEKLQTKIAQLKDRLKQYEFNQQNGQTNALLNSFKNIDKKQDQLSSYENGVTFLQRQLKKALLKLQKKNLEIKQLVSKMNNQSAQSQKQLKQSKDKYISEIKYLQARLAEQQQQIRNLNQQLRKRDKQMKQMHHKSEQQIDKLVAQNRSLININNDLQRDYNRILESKKVIQKSFREERQRSITSKSQIAIAKKQKWLELQRQKNDIQIIYKQKQEQLKTDHQIAMTDLRKEVDKIKRQKQLLEFQFNAYKQKQKERKQQRPQNEKQNVYSNFHKKLATVNLQIALTENLYNEMIKTKSKIQRSIQKQKPKDNYPKIQSLQNKKKQMAGQINLLNRTKSIGGLMRQIDKLSSNQSQHSQSRGHINFGHQVPLILDSQQQIGGQSPTFKMVNSFNPKFT